MNFVALCRVPGGEGTPYGGKWVTDVSRDAFVSEFEGWEPEVQQMLQVSAPPCCVRGRDAERRAPDTVRGEPDTVGNTRCRQPSVRGHCERRAPRGCGTPIVLNTGCVHRRTDEKTQMHAMPPNFGAGGGQAIEVSTLSRDHPLRASSL